MFIVLCIPEEVPTVMAVGDTSLHICIVLEEAVSHPD